MLKNPERDHAFLNAYEDDARFEVQKLLKGLPTNLFYHGARHTLDYVYPESMKLAAGENLSDELRLIAAVTALYHDTGFLDRYVANERFGAERAKAYAQNSHCLVLNKNSSLIAEAIIGTSMESQPKNLLEAIIRDADLAVLGKPEFLSWNLRLRQEILAHPESGMFQVAQDDHKWVCAQLAFFESQHWFTQTAVQMYQKQKLKNIQLFKIGFRDVLK